MVYLDFAATSAPSPIAKEEYRRVSDLYFGNPSSLHEAGYQAKRIFDEACKRVLSCTGLSATHRCIFTSGASESNSMAIIGSALRYRNRGNRILYGASEHASVKESCLYLTKLGYEAVELPLRDGAIDMDALESSIDKQTILLAAMSSNNETGALTDLNRLREIRRTHPKCLLLVDATQSMGKLPLDLSFADFISFSGHKIGAFKGSGCLLIRKGLLIDPLIHGGSQQDGLRAGTIDVAGASALSVALEDDFKNIEANLNHAKELKAALLNGLSSLSDLVEINSPEGASPYVVSFSLLHHRASVIVEGLSERGYCVSSVSACSSKVDASSYVLKAMGKEDRIASNAIRVSFGKASTIDELKGFVDCLGKLLQEVKRI